MSLRFQGLAAAAATFVPAAAHAECLGQGCYDGIVTMLILFGIGALVGAGLFIWLIVWLIGRRVARRRVADAPPAQEN